MITLLACHALSSLCLCACHQPRSCRETFLKTSLRSATSHFSRESVKKREQNATFVLATMYVYSHSRLRHRQSSRARCPPVPLRQMAETDFIRFVGRKSEDEQSKIAHVLVGEGDLRLRADASLLAVSNRFGALFSCTAQGLRWCWLADLHQQCTPNGAAAVFTSVTSVTGSPFMLALSSDNMQLAFLTVGEKTARLHLFDVAEILRGRSDIHEIFPEGIPSSRPARVPAFDRHECTTHELGLEGSLIDLQVSC